MTKEELLEQISKTKAKIRRISRYYYDPFLHQYEIYNVDNLEEEIYAELTLILFHSHNYKNDMMVMFLLNDLISLYEQRKRNIFD